MDKSPQSKKISYSTPDFSSYPPRTIKDVVIHPLGLEVIYEENKRTFHLSRDLREHATDPETTHPITKETLISPLNIPDDFSIKQAEISSDGFARVTWSHKITPKDKGVSVYHVIDRNTFIFRCNLVRPCHPSKPVGRYFRLFYREIIWNVQW